MTRTKGRACESGPKPKKKHANRAEAEAHIEREIKRSGADRASWGIYRCPHCHHLHVGHIGEDTPRIRRGKRRT